MSRLNSTDIFDGKKCLCYNDFSCSHILLDDNNKLYGDIDISKAKEYHDLLEQYYPIEMIVYCIKNNRDDFIRKGRLEIMSRTYKKI